MTEEQQNPEIDSAKQMKEMDAEKTLRDLGVRADVEFMPIPGRKGGFYKVSLVLRGKKAALENFAKALRDSMISVGPDTPSELAEKYKQSTRDDSSENEHDEN